MTKLEKLRAAYNDARSAYYSACDAYHSARKIVEAADTARDDAYDAYRKELDKQNEN